MINTLKIFSQKILYGFGFGSGMCVAYANADLIKFDIKSILNNSVSTNEFNDFNNLNSKK